MILEESAQYAEYVETEEGIKDMNREEAKAALGIAMEDVGFIEVLDGCARDMDDLKYLENLAGDVTWGSEDPEKLMDALIDRSLESHYHF